MYSAFAPEPRQSHSAKWRTQIAQEPAIHPRNAYIHLLRYAMAALEVARPDRSRKAVFRVIGHCHGFLFRIEGRDVTYGPENFFFHTTRRFRESSIDGWLHVETLVAFVAKPRDSPASHDARAFLSCQLKVGKNFFPMLRRNQRPQVATRIRRPSEIQAFRSFLQPIYKRRKDFLLHVNTFCA